MSGPENRPVPAPVRVPAGTTAASAVRGAGLSTTVVVVRDTSCVLRDLADLETAR